MMEFYIWYDRMCTYTVWGKKCVILLYNNKMTYNIAQNYVASWCYGKHGQGFKSIFIIRIWLEKNRKDSQIVRGKFAVRVCGSEVCDMVT